MFISKIQMLALFFLFILFLSCQNKNYDAENNLDAEKPNIILIYADDLGYGDLSSYGSEIPTPNIDKIGQTGIKFSSFYVTAPGCTPSRYSLLTGAYPQRSHHGLNQVIWAKHDGHLAEVETILPEYLSSEGYQTAIVGKWHLGGNPLDHGFDHFSGLTQGCIDYFEHVAIFPFDQEDYNYDWNEGKQKVKRNGYATNMIGDYTLQYIDKFSSSKSPFFIYVPFNAPHFGQSVEGIADKQNTINLKGDDPKSFDQLFPSLQAPTEYLDKFSHMNNIYRQYYAAMISSMDDNVGRIWEKLEEKDLLKNTIIWFASDNGGYSDDIYPIQPHSSNGPLRGSKGQLYEGGIRVPAMMTWQVKIRTPQIVEQPVLNADILPTLAAIIGFDQDLKNRTIDGQDISSILFEGEKSSRNIFWRYDQNGQIAYRKGDWKIVENELYNLAIDISESNDLSSLMPQKYQELKNAYDSVENNLSKYKLN